MSYSKQKIIHRKTPFHPATGKLSLKTLKNHRLSISRDYKITFDNYETALNQARELKKSGVQIFFYTLIVFAWSEADETEKTITLQTQRTVDYKQDDKTRWSDLMMKLAEDLQGYGTDYTPRFMRFIFVLRKEYAENVKSQKALNSEKLRTAKENARKQREIEKRRIANEKARIRRENKKYGILEAEARRRHAAKIAREDREFERRHNAAKRARIVRKAKALAKKGFI